MPAPQATLFSVLHIKNKNKNGKAKKKKTQAGYF